MEKMLNFLTGLAGFFLLSYGVFTALIYADFHWYSYFVLGLFLLLDRLDARLNHDSNLARLFGPAWRTPVLTYFTYLAGSLYIDVFLGTCLGHLWVYPRFGVAGRVVHVLLIGYPFALFSCSALYRVLTGLLQKFLNTAAPGTIKQTPAAPGLARLFLAGTILSFVLPLAGFLVFGRTHASLVIVISGVIGLFSFSPLSCLRGQPSVLGSLLNRDWMAILSLLASIPLNALAHELPNTFAWEWRYQNLPFASATLLDVPILVLTLGWSYLTIFGISGNELFFYHPKSYSRTYIPVTRF